MARSKTSRKPVKAEEPTPPPPVIRADIRAKVIEAITSKYVHWTPIETSWLRLKAETSNVPKMSVLKSLKATVRKSTGGCFLKRWNQSETTDYGVTGGKLDITRYTFQLNESPKVLERFHDYADNFKELLELLVRTSYRSNGVISFKDLLKHLTMLRLCYRQVTHLSPQLRTYLNLHALIVTANYLTNCPGICLPLNLKLVELHGNLLNGNVSNLMDRAPASLLYIGIGRNYLNNAQHLSNLVTFEHLVHLGLSENDFEDSNELFNNIKDIKLLKNLTLHGTPISMSISYEDVVARNLPQLETLDGQDFQRNFPADPVQDIYDGCLQIYGLKIFQVPDIRPQPTDSKQKKPKYFYQLEVELPLLDEELFKFEARPFADTSPSPKRPSSVALVPSTKTVPVTTVDSETMKNVKAEVVGRVEEVGSGEKNEEEEEGSHTVENDEKRKIRGKMIDSYTRWLTRDKEIPEAIKFSSERIKWAKIMNFKKPCIEVPVKRDWLRQLRDTMRSIITLRLYYKEVIYVPKEKKKDEDKSKSDDKRKSLKSESLKRGSVKRGSVKRGSVKRGSVKRGSVKRGSVKQGSVKSASVKRGSVKRGSVKRGSVKRGSVKRGSVKRGSMKRGSMKQGSVKRGSMKRGSTEGSSKLARKSKSRDLEEVTLKKMLIAKIPIPVEQPVWTDRFVGYTWDISSRCLAKKCENVEEIYFEGEEWRVFKKLGLKEGRRGSKRGRKSVAGGRKSVTGGRKSVSGGRKSVTGGRKSAGGRKSVAGGRKSVAGGRKSLAGKRKSTGGSRKSVGGGKRKSTGGRKSVTGKRKSSAGGRKSVSSAGKRKSSAGGRKSVSNAGKRKSTSGRKSIGSKGNRKKSKGPKVILPPPPEFLTCHLAVGLKRKNEAVTGKKRSKKGSRASLRKSLKRKSMKRQSVKRQSVKRQSVKRQSVKRKSMKRKSMKGK